MDPTRDEQRGRRDPDAIESPGRPGLRFLQWSIQGLRAKTPLQASLIEDEESVCLLQETLVRGDCHLRFPGYNAHHLPIRDESGDRGCLILVNGSIPHRAVECTIDCGEGVETQAKVGGEH